MFNLFKNKLFGEVFIIVFIGMFFIFSIFGVYSFLSKKNALLELLYIESINTAKTISLVSANAIVTEDDTFLFEFNFDYIKNQNNLKNIIISKKDKRYLIIQKDKWDYRDSLNKELLAQEANKIKSSILFSPILKSEIYHLTYPIELSGLNWGWIHLSLDTKEYEKNIEKLYIEYLLLFCIVSFISFISSYFIARRFTKPIIALNDATKKVSDGNFNFELIVNRKDEIGELTKTFNIMLLNLDVFQTELRKNNEDLENKILQRTEELKRTNEELEDLNTTLDIRIKEEIKKREKHQQLMIQQSRLAAMGEMISMIAHQWRQPLNAIGMLIQNVKLQYELGSFNKGLLDEMVSDSFKIIQKMSTTIDDFKEFFKPNKEKSNFNIYQVIKNTYSLLEASFVSRGIDINIDSTDSIEVYGYENELSQVIMNLLSNAKDALEENNITKPIIKVFYIEDENIIKICIEDNAGGINQKIKDKIFEPYFSTKDERNGTGLGLYMSKIIVENHHNGKLFFENTGFGTRFFIEVPRIKKC